MKRVLYALAVGILFVLLTKVTDAQTPQANLRGQIKRSRSASTVNTSLSNGSASIRTQRQVDTRQQTQNLFLQQQILLLQQSARPQFIAVPSRQRGVGIPNVTAKQFVPLSGSGQKSFYGDFGYGLGFPQQKPQIQRVNRISTGK